MVFGEPFTLQAPAGVPRREANRLLTEELRQRLAAHVHASSARTGIPLHGEHGEQSAIPHGVGVQDAAPVTDPDEHVEEAP